MHELSIAAAVVRAVADAAAPHGGRVGCVRLEVGRLSGVVAGSLPFAFEMAAAGTVLEGARLELDEVPVTAWCAACTATVTLDGLVFRCPRCGRPTPEVLGGRQLEIVSFDLEDDGAAEVHRATRS